MQSKREQVLSALADKLRAELSVTFVRGEPEPDALPENGMLVMDDGIPGEPIEVCLGDPPTYFWQHAIDLVAAAQHADSNARVAMVDAVFQNVQAIIDADPRLNEMVDYLESRPYELEHEDLTGGETVVRARAAVIIHYNSTSALG